MPTDSRWSRCRGCKSPTPLPERVATTDLFYVVARKAQAAGLTFYMFGADEAENAAAVANVRKMYPDLRIVGRCHGYLRGEALRDKVDEINALAPDYLWVALGVPYEQAFVEEFTPRLSNVGVIKTSGGLFNFLSGSRPRAPRMDAEHRARMGLANLAGAAPVVLALSHHQSRARSICCSTRAEATIGRHEASAADLKFLHRLPRAQSGTSSTSGTGKIMLLVPFVSEVRVRGCRNRSRTS